MRLRETNTQDALLAAAMELFSEKGYAAVTTKEIAVKAGVSEVTLFRYFETKSKLYHQVFEKYIFYPNLELFFEQNISWDLSKDLLNLALMIQEMVFNNSKLLKMSLKNDPDFHHNENLKKFPNAIKAKLASYFAEMKERGKITGEPEILAIIFLLANSGLYMNFYHNIYKTEFQHEECLRSLVDIFTRGIKR